MYMLKLLKKSVLSPFVSIISGYIYVFIFAIVLANGDFNNSSFFTWGVPVTYMGKKINDEVTYYLLLIGIFFHQLINNWINEVTYPWIINKVQNKDNKYLEYSKTKTMIIVNIFSFYSELDVVIIVSGIMSQISFFIVIVLANAISTTIISWLYINNKDNHDFIHHRSFESF